MITLDQFLQTVNYNITDGSKFNWQCFPTAFQYNFWNEEVDLSITFNTVTTEVYMAEAIDVLNSRPYRLLNCKYKDAFLRECENNGVDDTAYSTIEYIDLEVDDDFLEKARCIFLGKPYNTKIKIPLTLPDDCLFQLLLMAHNKDITFNQFVENIIIEQLTNVDKNCKYEYNNATTFNKETK